MMWPVKPSIRTAAAADNDAVASVIEGWPGRPILGALPRQPLGSFYRASLIIAGAIPVDAAPRGRGRTVDRGVCGHVPGYNGSGGDVHAFERAL
jgi:hypothetical protein